MQLMATYSGIVQYQILQNFWLGVHKTMEEIFHRKIPSHFETFILSKSDFIMENANKILFIIIITAAKKNITRLWLHSEPLTVRDWIATIEEIYSMDRITHAHLICKWIYLKKFG